MSTKKKIAEKVPKGSNGILLKNLYLFCDPYMRGKMAPREGSYFESFKPDLPISGYGVAKILDSENPEFRKGIPGMTAYAGFYEVFTHKEGETVFMSAASSAVGQLVGQFAKLLAAMLSEVLEAKTRYFPQGIDIYFENDRGKMLDAVLLNMKIHGRIAVSGMMSQYNISKPEEVHNLMSLIAKWVRMEGFLVLDYHHLYPKFLEMIIPRIKEGKIVYVEDTTEGLESAPAALIGLFSGQIVGKQVVAIAFE